MDKQSINYVDLHRPAIFAHRGSMANAPENTLAAFELAVEQGADGIELDAKLSADGEVVVMHDDAVDRTTDGSGLVGSLTVSELKRFDAGSKLDASFSSEKIPTLAEVFEAVGERILINVELKNYSSPLDDLPGKVVSLVKQFGLESSVLLSSFNLLALIRAQSLLPAIPLGLLTFKGWANIVLASRLISISSLAAIHPHFSDVTPRLIQAAHERGCRVHPFTVNQPAIMQEFFTAGIDGIITDDPLQALVVLGETKIKNI